MESADCFLADVIGSGRLRVLGVRGKRHQLWPQNAYPRWATCSPNPMGNRALSLVSCPFALANKLARIAWGVLHYGRDFEARNDVPNASQSA